MRSLQAVSRDGGIQDKGSQEDVVLYFTQRAEVDHHEVENFKREGDHCVCNQQSIVQVKTAVG
jgi:hypothetical protein